MRCWSITKTLYHCYYWGQINKLISLTMSFTGQKTVDIIRFQKVVRKPKHPKLSPRDEMWHTWDLWDFSVIFLVQPSKTYSYQWPTYLFSCTRLWTCLIVLWKWSILSWTVLINLLWADFNVNYKLEKLPLFALLLRHTWEPLNLPLVLTGPAGGSITPLAWSVNNQRTVKYEKI